MLRRANVCLGSTDIYLHASAHVHAHARTQTGAHTQTHSQTLKVITRPSCTSDHQCKTNKISLDRVQIYFLWWAWRAKHISEKVLQDWMEILTRTFLVALPFQYQVFASTFAALPQHLVLSLSPFDKTMNYLLSIDVPVRRWHVYMYMMCWRDEIPAVSTDNREAARWTLSWLARAFDGSEVFVLKPPKQLTLGLPFVPSKPFQDTTVAMVSSAIQR